MIHDSKILAWTIPSLFLLPSGVFSKAKLQKPAKVKNAPVLKNAVENKTNGIATITDAYQMAYTNNSEIQLGFNDLKILLYKSNIILLVSSVNSTIFTYVKAGLIFSISLVLGLNFINFFIIESYKLFLFLK